MFNFMGVALMLKVLKLDSGLLLNLRRNIFWAGSVLCFTILTAGSAYSEELADQEDPGDGKVEVVYAPNILEAYRERRSNFSTQISVGMENFAPEDFISPGDGSTYKSLFGSNELQLLQVSIGKKYNLSLGALAVDAAYSMGSIKSSQSGTAREFSLAKKALSVSYIMDALFSEPYVAPYFSAQVLEFDYTDKGSVAGSISGTTAATTGFTTGLLVQLNFVDPTSAAYVANRDFGLNNTFIDINVTQYNSSNSTDDINLASTLNWGAGLRLEF